MTGLRLVVVIGGFALSLFLFHKAAGTVHLGKINILSYAMYLFFLQTYAGASLMYLGDRNHYTMSYIMDPSKYDLTFYCVLLTAILFPLSAWLMFRICRIDIRERYREFLEQPVEVKSPEAMFWIVAVSGFLCCCVLLVYILKIGYFPLLRLLRTPEGFDFGVERQRIGSISVVNSYVTNIAIGLGIPLLSYISFAYALALKRKFWWWALTFVLVGSSIVSVTMDFEKSPVVFYLFVLLLVVMYVRGGLKTPVVVAFGAVAAAAIVFIYIRQGYDFSAGISNFYNGPIGRTLFTQVGTLAMHFDLFPAVFPFLWGRSLSPTAMALFGVEGSYVRSGKLVMDYYGSEKVFDGTGGVMNALFIGEAYANFGYAGMVLSIVYLGVLFGLLLYLFTRIRKNPYNLGIIALLTSRLAQATQGGFTDFIYNFQTILLLLLIPAGHFAPILWNRWVKPRWNARRREHAREKERRKAGQS